jgi:uncharacterized protein (DUF169 family)
MDRRESADRISSALGLDTPPIALSFADSAPAGVQNFAGEVPSACTFWRQAETAVFYASAAKHFNCPIGTMTMGFEMPETVQQELMGLVTTMCETGYITPEEPAMIPTSEKKAAGIVYGPLSEFPLEPDIVLMWLTPRQAMFYNEAVGNCRWTTTAPVTAWGRPACAALPLAMKSDQSTLSLGCMGMRTYTEINEDRLLAVLPGNQVDDLMTSLETTLQSNEVIRTYNEGRKAAYTS